MKPGIEAVTVSEAIQRHQNKSMHVTRWFRVRGSMQTLTSGSAPPRTIEHGTIFITPETSIRNVSPHEAKNSASWPSKNYSSPKAAIGIGGMAPSTLQRTIANSMNYIASTCRTCIRRWARLRRIILLNQSRAEWFSRLLLRRRTTSIPM